MSDHNWRLLGHHECMRRRPAVLSRRCCWVLTFVAATVSGLLVAALPVGAATCSTVMTFQFDPGSGGVVLSPQKLTVAAGACVTLHNSTITSADFTVGAKYKQTAPAFSDASPDYTAGPAGTTQPVTATGAAGTAHGSIVVTAAPKPAHSTPPPTHSPSPQPTHTASASPSAKPSPSGPAAPPPTAAPPPVTPLVSPPAGSTPFLAGRPTPTPSPSDSESATVVSGPLQPPTNRGTGLPAALAALAVVGTAAALLRVLLAEPLLSGSGGAVDDGHRTVGAAL